MTTTLKSNWMGSKNSAPTIFRAASRGNVFTRSEKLKMIFAEKDRAHRKAERVELLFQERNKAAEEKAKRERFFAATNALQEHPDAKVRHSKSGSYIQPRVNGAFQAKIAL
jgi:hypothetical protein